MGAPGIRIRPLGNVLTSSRAITGGLFETSNAPSAFVPSAFASCPLRQSMLPFCSPHPHPGPSPHRCHHGLTPLSASTHVGLMPHASLVRAAGPGSGPAQGWALPLGLRSPARLRTTTPPPPLESGAAPSIATDSSCRSATASPGDRSRSRSRKGQPRQLPQGPRTSAIHQDGAVLFIGFHPEELDVIRQRLPEVLPVAAEDDGGTAAAATTLVDVTYDMLSCTVRDILLQRASAAGGYAGTSEDRVAAVAVGRVVLLVGPTARELGGQLNDLLAEWGIVPALIAAHQPGHEGMPLRQLVTFLRDSHAAYYGLLQPVRVERPLQPEAASGGDCSEAAATNAGPPTMAGAAAMAGGSSGGEAAAAAAALRGCGVAGCGDSAAASVHEALLEDVRVLLCAAMDAGEVPSIHGRYRRDAGHVVVLDGLLSVSERRELVDWLTSPGHNHAGPPPGDKWEMVCVDREGARPTWGLQPHMLKALREQPPPPVVALQTRLAALYPEYDICHMPADQISDEYGAGGGDGTDGDGDSTPLSSFVANAVMVGDPCAWHADADPTTVPPHSPWVHNFGYYHNRELRRPLFVSVLLYLNDSWPEDYHSETLFLDPETQLGLFVRPVPGRVVLLEQDLPHRISAPSLEAPGPRYSLVWKLVFVPRETPAGSLGAPPFGHAPGSGISGSGVSGTTRGKELGGMQQHGHEEEEEVATGCVGAAGEFHSICRPEWGEPVRIGSASARCGIPAFRRRMQM